MPRMTAFHLPPKARLWDGETLVSDTAMPRPDAFHRIPVNGGLPHLLAALKADVGFCVSDTALPPASLVQPTDFVTLSGGSTGAPKFILRSQTSWIASFDVHASAFALRTLERTAVLGDLSHSLALYGVLEGLHLGHQVHVLAALSPLTQRKRLSEQAVQVLYATPTQLRLLAHAASSTLLDVTHIFCGGGALDGATTNAIATLCPNAMLHPFYGAAESSFVSLADTDTPPGSVGKPYPGVEISMRAGEIWVRSPYLFKGYIGAESSSTKWRDGFLSVGELGHIDAEGYLWITGRTSRQVNIADQLVSPEGVEAFVADHPSGGPCAVLPVLDNIRGCRLALILEGRTDSARAVRIRQACVAQFGPLIAPRRVLFRDCFPRLASGKNDLMALSQWMKEQT